MTGKSRSPRIVCGRLNETERALLQELVHPLFAADMQVRVSWSFFGSRQGCTDGVKLTTGPVKLSPVSTVVWLGRRMAQELGQQSQRGYSSAERVVTVPCSQPPEVVFAALSLAMYLSDAPHPRDLVTIGETFAVLVQVPRRSDQKGIRATWKEWQRRARLDIEAAYWEAFKFATRSHSFRWLREEKEPTAYLERLAGAFAMLRQGVHINSVPAMVRGTRLLSPQARKPEPYCTLTAMWHSNSSVLEVACRRAREGFRVAAVNVASAYSVGGGFLTGGRHSLEESMCMQSTLYYSLQRAARFAHELQIKDGAGKPINIPEDGAVLSPGVEVFRCGATGGYAPNWHGSVTLHGVVSVSMPNMNPAVVDCPLDSHSRAQREALIEKKLHAVLQGAALVDAEVLVLPDLGCSVYGSDATMLGSVFGRVLYGYPFFTEVVISGSHEFFSAASEEAGSRYNLMCRQPIDAQKLRHKAQAACPEGGPIEGFYSAGIQHMQDFKARGISMPCGCVQGISLLLKSLVAL